MAGVRLEGDEREGEGGKNETIFFVKKKVLGRGGMHFLFFFLYKKKRSGNASFESTIRA